MRVLFVYPDIGIRGGALSFQFGLGHLSSYLKQYGHETALHYVRTEADMARLDGCIQRFEPDVVAFTATSPQYRHVRAMLAGLSKFSVFTVCGGPHVTLYPRALEDTPGLDAVCLGEGENALLGVVEALGGGGGVEEVPGLWVKTSGGIRKNPPLDFISDIDSLPLPDRELFNYQEIINSDFGTALFMFSRGCPFECTYCSNHALKQVQNGKYFRLRSVPSCMAEIEDVISRYRVETLYFNDDVFTIKKEHVIEFCGEYSRMFRRPFHINARAETLDEEVCALLKEAGCVRIDIGIESGHEEFRRKVLKRRMTNNVIAGAFEAAKKAGIKTKSFNIVGYPLEKPEYALETIRLNRRIQPDSLVAYIFEPYPGTELYATARENGFLRADPWETDFKPRTDTVLRMPDFPRRRIVRIYRYFGFNVYRGKNFRKAVFYLLFYSRYGEAVLKLASPFKKFLRKLFMGV